MAKKILIIEDDPIALRLTEYTFKQHGYQVLATYNGLEGIITAQKEEPDLIILDVMLPGIDGYEVCNRLRSGAQTAQIPILIISGKAQEEDIAIGFQAGANDYLPKPAAPSDIISRVERLLAEKPSGNSKVIAFLSSNQNLGMTVILANLAAAISELGKQVTLADIVNRHKSGTSKAAQFPRGTSSVILDTHSINIERQDSALEVLPSGIRMLHINDSSEHEDIISNNSIDLLQKVGDINDYLLVDLPFKPTAIVRSTLSNCDLIIIASDYRINNIYELKNTVMSIRFLGIAPKKIATLLIDPEGTFSGISLGSLKPYIEANLGITLAGAISLDVKLYQLSYLDSPPIIQSNPSSQLANNIKQIAQYIVAHGYTKQQPYQSMTKVSYLEKG